MNDRNESGQAKKGMSALTKAKLIGAAIGVILLVILTFQNLQQVETRILFMTITMPRAVLIAATALIGFALGVLLGQSLRRPKKSDA